MQPDSASINSPRYAMVGTGGLEDAQPTRENIFGSNTRANQILGGVANGDRWRYQSGAVSPFLWGNGGSSPSITYLPYEQYSGYTNVPQMQRLQQLGEQWQREKSLDNILRELFANEGVYD